MINDNIKAVDEAEKQVKAQEQTIIALMKAVSFTQMPAAQQKLLQLRLELRNLKYERRYLSDVVVS